MNTNILKCIVARGLLQTGNKKSNKCVYTISIYTDEDDSVLISTLSGHLTVLNNILTYIGLLVYVSYFQKYVKTERIIVILHAN